MPHPVMPHTLSQQIHNSCHTTHHKVYVVQENCDGGVPPNYQSQAINGIRNQLNDVWPSYKGTLAGTMFLSLVQLGWIQHFVACARCTLNRLLDCLRPQ